TVVSAVPVQRKVGFEFESQYNVREKATPDENQELERLYYEDRNSKIDERTRELIEQKLTTVDKAFFETNQSEVNAYKRKNFFAKLFAKKPQDLGPDWLEKVANYYASPEGR